MSESSKPQLILIAGPNGSGKSTITEAMRKKGIDFGVYVNPDEIAAQLGGNDLATVKKAQMIAENERHRLLSEGVSHSFESVMSHPSKIEYLVEAKAKGLHVILVFVGINDPAVNVQRVANRVAKGGHDVPIDKIVARYQRTMNLLFEAAEVADHVQIYDNSGDQGIQLVAEVKEKELISYKEGFPWVQTFFMDKYKTKYDA